jgi:hypothetical protein
MPNSTLPLVLQSSNEPLEYSGASGKFRRKRLFCRGLRTLRQNVKRSVFRTLVERLTALVHGSLKRNPWKLRDGAPARTLASSLHRVRAGAGLGTQEIMMRYLNAIVVVAAVAAMGCADEGDDGARGSIDAVEGSTTQTEFDLTYDDHRSMFEAVDMLYHSSLGPYAIFEITGANPHLVGPSVAYNPDFGNHAMLCGAGGIFTPTPYSAETDAALVNQVDIGMEYVATQLQATDFGNCVEPQDDFGDPVPPAAPPTNEPPNEQPPPESQPPETPPSELPGGEEVPVLKNAAINVQIDNALLGSMLMLRRVAIGIEEQHNNSHVIPSICCNGPNCDLQFND